MTSAIFLITFVFLFLSKLSYLTYMGDSELAFPYVRFLLDIVK